MLFISLTLSLSLSADPILKQFVSDGGSEASRLSALVGYKNASEIFLNKKIKKEIGTKMVETVDYKEAFLAFEKSAIEEKNPLSAYAAIYIINNFSLNPNAKKKYALVHALNDGQDFCYAKMLLGDLYLRGVDVKINKRQAHDIYTSINTDTCNIWQSSVLNAKIKLAKRGE